MGNGLTVILHEDHAAPLVAVDIWVKAGSGSETADNSGVSHFIEHLAFAATSNRDPGEMDIEMETAGAVLNAHTWRDWAHFHTTVSSRYVSKALDVLADAMMNSQFRKQDIHRESLIIQDEISKKQTDPMRIAKDHLAKALYGDHPYGLPVEGTAKSISSLTRDDILDYYKKHYVAGNTAVVLVGDIGVQKALAEVGRAFQGMPSTAAPEFASEPPTPPQSQVNISIESPYGFNYLGIGFLGPPGSEYEDVCAMDVLMSYLGFGYRSWMSDVLRGKMELAVNVSADFLTHRQEGMISLIAAAKAQNAEKAKGAIFAELARLSEGGISQQEMDIAQRSLLGTYAFETETYEGMASSLGFYYAVSEPQFSDTYVECIRAVTNADIVRVAKKYLHPDHAVVVTLEPSNGGSQ